MDVKTKLRKIIEMCNIRWENIISEIEVCGWWNSTKFDITPDEFINFAKEDYKADNRKALINALSNSKRAIDSHADSILYNYGYKPKRIERLSNYPGIKTIIDEYKKESELLSGIPLKFKFLQSIGIAPQSVIYRIRKLRNLLEHEYKLPEKQEVLESIEIAEMFIKSSRHSMFELSIGRFIFGTKIYTEKNRRFILRRFKKSIEVDFKYNEEKYGDIHFNISALDSAYNTILKVEVYPKDDQYIYFLLIHLHQEWNYLPLAFGYDNKIINLNVREESM